MNDGELLLTTDALWDEAGPEVGQGQPGQVVQLLQGGGGVDSHRLLPLPRGAEGKPDCLVRK